MQKERQIHYSPSTDWLGLTCMTPLRLRALSAVVANSTSHTEKYHSLFSLYIHHDAIMIHTSSNCKIKMFAKMAQNGTK